MMSFSLGTSFGNAKPKTVTAHVSPLLGAIVFSSQELEGNLESFSIMALAAFFIYRNS